MTNRPNKALEYYNDYIDCTQNLPSDVQRHVTQMRECDLEYQEMLSKVKELADGINGPMSALNSEKLTKLLVTGLNVGDRKVQTVQQISDLVDDKVRRLKNGKKYFNLAKEFDAPKPSIKEKPESSNSSKDRCLPSTSTSTVSKELKKRNPDNDSNESKNDAKLAKRSRRNRADEPDCKELSHNVALSTFQHSNTPLPRSTATAQIQSQVTLKKATKKTETKTKKKGKYKKQLKDNSLSLDDDDDDIAVDPDEPTYCLCDQISYGEMICCDNDLCPIQWFHFSCVLLSTKPKGKWFCPKCRGDRPNVMKPKAQFLKELEQYNKEKEDNA